MVNLYDEDAVDEQVRRAMYSYNEQRARETSRKRARQGVQLAYPRGGPHSFILDTARRALYGQVDKEAEERIRDHGSQIMLHPAFAEARGLNETVGAGGAAVPPAHLQSEFEYGAHPLRATADVCRRLPIPATSQIVVPAFTSGSSAAVDSTQNQSLAEGDPTDTTILANVTTVAASFTVSRQLLDQASPDSGIDEVVSSDIGAAYGAQLDSSVLTGPGGAGQMTGLLNVSGALTVGAGTSVAGLFDGIATGFQTMVQARYRKPDVAIMHPRRWLSGYANSIDLQGRPLALPSTHPAALVGTADDGVVAEWLGMKVILDVNVPITSGNGSQDYVILGHSRDWLLYEGPLNFEANKAQLAYQLSVTLVGWRYAALAVRYPTSVCLVGPFNAPTTPGS